MNSKKSRFIIVGLANTAVDFLVFLLAVKAGINPIIANYLSTTVALCLSFVLNKSFTFKVKNKTNFREFAMFTIVTLFGLWVLQPIVIKFTLLPLQDVLKSTEIAILGTKILATTTSLIWNYFFYDKVVFRGL